MGFGMTMTCTIVSFHFHGTIVATIVITQPRVLPCIRTSVQELVHHSLFLWDILVRENGCTTDRCSLYHKTYRLFVQQGSLLFPDVVLKESVNLSFRLKNWSQHGYRLSRSPKHRPATWGLIIKLKFL